MFNILAEYDIQLSVPEADNWKTAWSYEELNYSNIFHWGKINFSQEKDKSICP